MTGSTNEQETTTDRGASSRSVSPYRAGLGAKCPSCGEGKLFENGLSVRQQCDVCGFDLSAADPGDGAQVFVILIMGALTALMGFIVVGALHWPLWAVASVCSSSLWPVASGCSVYSRLC